MPLTKSVTRMPRECGKQSSAEPVFQAPRYPSCAFRKTRRRAGIVDLHLHDMRHAYASRLVSRGTSLYKVSKLLGHKDTRMTVWYAHLALHPEHPVSAGDLSKPFIGDLYECQDRILVWGHRPGATLRVRVEHEPLIHVDTTLAVEEVFLDRPLRAGQPVWAKQIVNGVEGEFSDLRTVDPLPDTLPTPVIREDVYDCAECVAVDNVLPGARTHLLVKDVAGEQEVGSDVSSSRTAHPGANPRLDYDPAPTLNQSVRAIQVACEGDPQMEKRSESAPVSVKPAPDSVRDVQFGPWVPGDQALHLKNMLVGAHLEITRDGKPLWWGCAPEESAVLKLQDPMASTTLVDATQSFCNSFSETASAGGPSSLSVPTIKQPVYEGDEIIHLENIHTNASLVVYRIGPPKEVVAYGGGGPGTVALNISRGVKALDELVAYQYVGTTDAASAIIQVQAIPVTPPPPKGWTPPPTVVKSGVNISSVTPASASRGTTVTVTGKKLDEVDELQLSESPNKSGQTVTFTLVSATELTFVVPNNASSKVAAIRLLKAGIKKATSSFKVARTPGPFHELATYPQFQDNSLISVPCGSNVAWVDSFHDPSTVALVDFKVYFALSGTSSPTTSTKSVQGGTFPGGIGIGGATISNTCQVGIVAEKKLKNSATNKDFLLTFYDLTVDPTDVLSTGHSSSTLRPVFQNTAIQRGYKVFLSPDETVAVWVSKAGLTGTQVSYGGMDLISGNQFINTTTAATIPSAGDFQVTTDNKVMLPGGASKPIP